MKLDKANFPASRAGSPLDNQLHNGAQGFGLTHNELLLLIAHYHRIPLAEIAHAVGLNTRKLGPVQMGAIRKVSGDFGYLIRQLPRVSLSQLSQQWHHWDKRSGRAIIELGYLQGTLRDLQALIKEKETNENNNPTP